MILSATLSKPAKNVEELLGRPYEKIKIKIENGGGEVSYFAQMFTKTQVFHKHLNEKELDEFLEANAGITFKNCLEQTEAEEISIMANKKGKITKLSKALKKDENLTKKADLKILPQPAKNYLLKEGQPVPFLVLLGIMTAEGKVIKAKYDKFRQINRFLEFIDDVLPEVKNRPVNIADFGCGKSYLTFAVYYYLWQIENIPVQITGLDLKEDVIAYCQKLSDELNYDSLNFFVGNIADFSYENKPDIIITLHACDTATDFALNFAVKQNALAILSVPCCQHEINLQLEKNKSLVEPSNPFASLEHWGIFRERFAALATDAIRAELLEQAGYSVQVLEFIDMEHTPKNILLRAVRKRNVGPAKDGCVQSDGLEDNAAEKQINASVQKSRERLDSLLKTLGASQSLCGLLES
ncbi:MAG TPA: methyltransferase [Treponema sp.]|nr:methyltransferase [Treponema sp.]